MKVLVGGAAISDGSDLCVDVDISMAVMEHLRELNLMKPTSKNKMQPRTNVFSVSQSSYDCQRKIFYEMTQPRHSDDKKLGTFTVGDIIHNLYQDALKKQGAKVEVGCGKDYFDGAIRIQGSGDAKLNDSVVEIKTVSPFAWKYIVGGKDKFGGVIIGEPKIQHIRQINTYMDLLGLKRGLIIYVNKDDLSIKVYSIDFSEQMMLQTVGRCVMVWKTIIDKSMPTKVKSNECLYCNHSDLCKK